MASRFARSSVRALWLALRVYLLVLIALFFFQRRLIYLPNREPEPAMLAMANNLGAEPWRDASGAIIGWKSPTGAGAPPANRLVVFHGNAGFALMRTHFIEGFRALDGGRTWEVFLFEYPGFGARPGKLGEKSFTEAGRAALAQLAAADNRPIYLLGESLGSGPACVLAGGDSPRVAGVFLITPYASLATLAQHLYPVVPVRLLLRDRWENVAALPKFRGRVAVMLAGEDEIIPIAQGRQLFDAAHEPKRLWIEAGATHNGLNFDLDAPWWQAVSAFLLAQ